MGNIDLNGDEYDGIRLGENIRDLEKSIISFLFKPHKALSLLFHIVNVCFYLPIYLPFYLLFILPHLLDLPSGVILLLPKEQNVF